MDALPRPVEVARWTGLAVAVGVLSGLASAGFLWSLEHVTETRLDHPWLLWLLPVAGLAIGLVGHRLGGRAGAGTTVILDEIHTPTDWVPRRMAPLVLGGTLVTHLFGGSAGREGTALQMAGSLTDGGARLLGLGHRDRRVLLVAALAGGFGSVFGVPVAGAVFGLEVQPGGRRLRLAAVAPALVASVVGDRVVRLLDVHHTPTPTLDVDLGPALLAKVALAAVAFGLVSAAFAVLVHRLRAVVAERVGWAPLRPVLGGLAVIALTLLVGTRDYLGLSLPLLGEALAGADVAPGAFALKLVFTVVTLGCGFQGGEVTPLFVIGATCGAALGQALGVPLPLMAAVGLAAVFAGATKTPLACTVLGVELFGWGPVLPLALACALAVAVSGGPGIYVSATRPAPPARWGRGRRRR